MEFGANILKQDAAYYTLNNAEISSGLLSISPGGSAEVSLNESDIAKLTEYFRISYVADAFSNPYSPIVRVFVKAALKSGEAFNFMCSPVDLGNGVYTQELKLAAGEYSYLVWRIESDISVEVSLWELSPEATDLDVTTIIDGVEQALPRLIYDYNTWPLRVEQNEIAVAVITYRLLDKTDLQGHFLLNFYASEPAILTIRVYTNEVEELFAPLMYDIHKGYNTLGIPHCYLKRSAGVYSAVVTAQATRGFITIPTRGMLYSIDGGYLAAREIDIGMDVRDLALRQLKQSQGPDEVWLIGVDAGEVLVRKRAYNESNASVQFTPVTSLGNGIAAAIEFDGVWVFRIGEYQYTIETDEEPWYFWVDADYTLWGQHGSDSNSLVQLDTGVTAVSACRGYRSIQFLEQDQGLVVAYIKNGYPYYRQWCYLTVDNKKRWLDAELLINEQFSDVRVHRLTDYRLSFELTGDTRNLWLYTERTYVNNAAPYELVPQPTVLDVGTWNYMPAGLDEELRLLSSTMSDDRMRITLIFDKPLKLITGWVSMQDVLTFSSGIVWDDLNDETNQVKSVVMEINEELLTTTLTIDLIKPPTKLTVSVYWDTDNNPFVRKCVGGKYWVHSLTTLSAEFDATIYDSYNFLAEASVEQPKLTQLGFMYDSVQYQAYTHNEILAQARLSPTGFAYSLVKYESSAIIDELLQPRLQTIGFVYSQISDEPI